ncbi:MarR family transcriptional regulator [Aeromicrobium sp. CFBP 8757]|uniref:MarR family winged helix-turn-helix transcriptional regulator n=1 Tax=Aeromicrobium sp. CFBP 8757 TaxID=2775288 RepID=UPI0018D6C14C
MRALQPALRELLRTMDDDLVREHRMSQTEYLVLMHLSESPDRRLAMSELAGRCHQSLSAVSRTVGRLEKDGCVTREQASADGRSFQAVLTDVGLDRLREAWPTHLESVRRSFLDHLGDVDIEALAHALSEIARARRG